MQGLWNYSAAYVAKLSRLQPFRALAESIQEHWSGAVVTDRTQSSESRSGATIFLWSDRNAKRQVRSSAPFPKTKRASFSVFVCGPDCLLYFREFPRWTSRHNLFDDFRMRQQIIVSGAQWRLQLERQQQGAREAGRIGYIGNYGPPAN